MPKNNLMEVRMRGINLEIKQITNGWILKIENHLDVTTTESEKYFKTFDEIWDYLSKAHPEQEGEKI